MFCCFVLSLCFVGSPRRLSLWYELLQGTDALHIIHLVVVLFRVYFNQSFRSLFVQVRKSDSVHDSLLGSWNMIASRVLWQTCHSLCRNLSPGEEWLQNAQLWPSFLFMKRDLSVLQISSYSTYLPDAAFLRSVPAFLTRCCSLIRLMIVFGILTLHKIWCIVSCFVCLSVVLLVHRPLSPSPPIVNLCVLGGRE